MSMFDQDSDEVVLTIPKLMPTNADLFRSFRNQPANMMIQAYYCHSIIRYQPEYHYHLD